MTPLLQRPAAALLLALALASCRAERQGETPVDPPVSRGVGTLTGLQSADRAERQRLENRARAAARADGCAATGSCAAAPLGAKACGGPRDYVVYCRLTTDEGELTARLEALERFERAYNERYGIASDCAMVMPPTVAASGGSCRAGN